MSLLEPIKSFDMNPQYSVCQEQKKYTTFPSSKNTNAREITKKPLALEFFAGSGLVSYALNRYFKVDWANDLCPKKAVVYRANHGNRVFQLGSIEDIKGKDLPAATLSWASFPCQDLSLAGLMGGINAKRSGLVWEWFRVMDEMTTRPPILVAENVIGLVSAEGGAYYRALHRALVKRGYKAGAVLLDASRWVPQSRPRVFVIAISNEINIPQNLFDTQPNWLHADAIIRASKGIDGWVWWRLPEPRPRKLAFVDIVDTGAACDDADISRRNLAMISKRHVDYLKASKLYAVPGYKRTRNTGQMLELRFDGVAGCLRTPEGGSSRQLLVIRDGNGELKTRLLTVRETARLMGAPESYKLPGSYNDGYRAMGDGVAVPVTRWLARHLLTPLAGLCSTPFSDAANQTPKGIHSLCR